MLFILVAVHAQNLKKIRKSIPHKKVTNVVAIPANDKLYKFDYKEGKEESKGLWDNEKGKVVHTSKQAFQLFSSPHKNAYLIYNDHYTGVYLPSNSKTYLVNVNAFIKLLKGRYNLHYDNYDSTLNFRDTLSNENIIVSRTPKDIMLEYYNKEKETQNFKIIDLATNKITIDINGGYLRRIKMGYVQEIDTVNIYYNTSYKKLNHGFTKSDILNEVKLSDVVGCKVDSILNRNYEEVIFSCNGKIGSFSYTKGITLEPIYDMIKSGFLLDVLITKNKLGAYNSISDLFIPATYTLMESYAIDFCSPYVKIGDRVFEGTYFDCEIFDQLNEIKNTDSLNLTREKRDALATVVNGNLIYSRGARNYYDSGSDGEVEKWRWWYAYEGSSGVYNFDKAKWLIAPDKYLVHPYGKNYLVGENYREGDHGNFYFVDSTFQKNNDKVYANYKYVGNQLFVFDSNYVWFAVNEATSELNELGIFTNSDIIKERNGYFIMGHQRKSRYNYNDFVVDGVLGKDLKKLKTPDAGWYDDILINDYAIITRDLSEYGDYEFALYDLLNEEVLSKWDYSESHKTAGKVTIGYGKETEVYDLTTLRK